MPPEGDREANRAAVKRFSDLPIGDDRLALYADDAVKQDRVPALPVNGES